MLQIGPSITHQSDEEELIDDQPSSPEHKVEHHNPVSSLHVLIFMSSQRAKNLLFAIYIYLERN